MDIYIDFDDVLCETAYAFTVMAHDMFGKDASYEKVFSFNLQDSFGLTDEQYACMMQRGHEPEVLLSYAETTGASEVVNSWMDNGHNVFIMTGRPASAYEPSRQWLDQHGLDRAKLYCVNKYGRDSFIKGSTFGLELDEFYKMKFDFAVEDSPSAFKHLLHLTDCTVAVFDRPWNRIADFPNEHFIRCKDWKAIDELLNSLQ